MERMRTTLATAFLAAACAALPACTTVSGTGRSQLNIMTPAQEKELGASAYQEALGQPGVKKITSGPDYDRVQRVGARIATAAKRLHPDAVKGFEWQWTVIDDPKTVNAWALPGGKSAVYTGMLVMAKTDDELAVVMGHEAAHAIARHSGERISSDMMMQAALEGTAMAVSGLEPAQQGAVMAALGVGSQYGVALPWSRMQESEADELGLFIAADAGYDPRSAIPLWERMGAQGGSPPEFMSTHPSEDTRIRRLKKLMPLANQAYSKAVAADGGPAPGSTPVGAPEPIADPKPAKGSKANKKKNS